jgi:hypothetical protein
MEAIILKIRNSNHLLRFEVQVTQINRGFFFTHVRRMMFSNILQQSQVDGMNAILDGWEAKYTADDDRWLAYALATTYHETDHHMRMCLSVSTDFYRPKKFQHLQACFRP